MIELTTASTPGKLGQLSGIHSFAGRIFGYPDGVAVAVVVVAIVVVPLHAILVET